MTFDEALTGYQRARTHLREQKGYLATATMERAAIDKKMAELDRAVAKASAALVAAADQLKPELEKEVSSDVAKSVALEAIMQTSAAPS